MATIKTLIGNLKSSTYDVYSTTETIVGTWIDGKPIYRKTFNNISVTSSEHSVTPIATGLTIDNLINILTELTC